MTQDPSTAVRLTRRGLLTGAAAVAGLEVTRRAVAGAAPAASTSAAPSTAGGWQHAVEPRGSDIAVAVGREKEGRFGVMFKKLPAYAPPDELLRSLAARMGEPSSTNPFDLDNPRITAGYTFFGQFVDHDLTLDRTPLPEQQVDPYALTNYDTARLDLGSVYGRGPAEDPELYEPDGVHLRVVRNEHGVLDLPRREDGTALVGDGRNDENLLVGQLHLAVLLFHNRLLDTGLAADLATARRLTRWHVQWAVVHNFLPLVAGEEVVARFLDEARGTVRREFYKPANPHRPMMPVEYSAAAYRFGHSMVRSAYLLSESGGTRVIAPIFGAEGSDLRGSRPLPARLVVDWRHFFSIGSAPRNQARLIDGTLALPLFSLPPTVVRDASVSLAERNLLRGKRLGLPSGQAVAREMGLTPLTNAELGLPDPADPGWGGEAPLWFYVLREAELQRGGQRLGAAGGRLVTEVILGLLDRDRDSYLKARPAFRPLPAVAGADGSFGVGDLVAFAHGG
jgi:hypothetical protein